LYRNVSTGHWVLATGFRVMIFPVPRGTRAPISIDWFGATDNEGPYLRPSSQGSWMEEMRAHRKCAPSSFMTHTVRNQFTT